METIWTIIEEVGGLDAAANVRIEVTDHQQTENKHPTCRCDGIDAPQITPRSLLPPGPTNRCYSQTNSG